VQDLYTDSASHDTAWLVRVAASFLAACALGLEYSTSRAVAETLKKTTLVLDTDVVLSLLGEGEPEHESVETIVRRWTQNGGRVFVAEPVLEEVAYHASIADKDYEQVKNFLPGTPATRIHAIDNVFVRSFAELLGNHSARRSDWPAYIRQFRGGTARDWNPVMGVLNSEYNISKLPPGTLDSNRLEIRVGRFLLEKANEKFSGNVPFNVRDKTRRDAALYSALVHYARSVRTTEPSATCLLISSARRLTAAEVEFRESGEPHLVVSIATVLYLVSLLPHVVLGLRAMKAFLFDYRHPGFSSELDRALLRAVISSQRVSLPFAKRNNLRRYVRERLIKDARASGIKPTHAEIERLDREALAPDNKKQTVELLAEALDSVVADTRVEKENERLRKQVEELQSKLARLELEQRRGSRK
jgi:hypothetical protein